MAEPTIAPAAAPTNIRELVITLFELGREVTSVLDLDELLQKIPQLIARLTKFHAFAAYLLDEKGEELSIAYSVGYPEHAARLKLKVGHGLVGAAVAEGRPILVRFLWSDITKTTCRWEQAFSVDDGATWEVNWIMESTRIE